MTTLVLYFLPLLLAACYCAPATYSIGGKIGGRSVIDGEIGGSGKIIRDHLALDARGRGLIGARWDPSVYGGAFAQVDDKMYVADGSLGGTIKNYMEPRGHAAFGINGKGEVPLALEGGSTLLNEANIVPVVGLHTGDEAWERAALYGASVHKNQY